MNNVSAFERGISDPAKRWVIANKLLSELVQVKQMDEHEVDGLFPIQTMSFELAVGTQAEHLWYYSDKTLDQRIDFAFAQSCEVVDRYRDMKISIENLTEYNQVEKG